MVYLVRIKLLRGKHIHVAVPKRRALAREKRGYYEGIFPVCVVAFRLNNAAVLQHPSPRKARHMHAEAARFLIVFPFPAFKHQYAFIVPAAQMRVALRHYSIRVRLQLIVIIGIAAFEPFLGVRGELEHRAGILYIRAHRVHHNVVRVRMAQKRPAKPAVRMGVEARFLHHVAAYEQIVQQLCIFVFVMAAAVVFAQNFGQRLRRALVCGVVRGNYRLRHLIHQIRANVLYC